MNMEGTGVCVSSLKTALILEDGEVSNKGLVFKNTLT